MRDIPSILAVLLLTAPGVQAATQYTTSPAEASQLLNGAQPGDVVVLKAGVYSDATIRFNAGGTAEAPVRFRADTPGGVTFTGDSSLVFGGAHVTVSGFVFDQAWGSTIVAFDSAERCTLRDCAFVECGSPTSPYPHIISLYNGSRHNSVTYCYMRGNLSIGMGVRIRPDDFDNTHNQFSHNYFKDITRRSSNGQEAVQIGQGGFSDRIAQYATVEYCLFDNASGDAEIISNKSSSNTYRYNTFRDCRAMLVLRGGSRTTVAGNVFIGNSGGIRVHNGFHTIVNNYIQDCDRDGIYLPSGARHYGPVNYCVIAHNTIVNCGRYGIYLGQPNTHPSTTWMLVPAFNDFLNNVIVGERGMLVRDDGSHVTSWRGNIVWAHGEADPGLEAEGLARRDPGLQQGAEGLWHPEAESVLRDPDPANFRDVNQPIPEITHDVFARPRDARPDVGSEEIAAGPPRRLPLTPDDVGPRWMKGNDAGIRRIPSPKPIPKIRSRRAPPLRSKQPEPLTLPDTGHGVRVLEAEACALHGGAERVDLGDGQVGVRLGKAEAQAEALVRLPKGTWVARLHLYAEDTDHDAVYLYAAGSRLRTYPENQGVVSPAVSTLRFQVTADKPTPIILVPGETNVCIDRVELRPE